jgi:rhodanese-related sulfurtransferase
MQSQNMICRKCNPDEMQFQRIFDGKTFTGWVNYADGGQPKGWVVEEGALARKEGGGDIMTAKQYDNFELQLDWKISEKGNSGIMYRVKAKDGQPYFSGPEFQILDDSGHGLDDSDNNASGALYGLVAAKGKTLKSVGEYNHARLVVQGNHVEHWLNGKKVVDIDLHSDRWNKLVQGSKFAKWSQFGQSQSGHIDLQDHGTPVWYKNITLRVLPPRSNATGPTFGNISTGSSRALIHQHGGSDQLVVLDVRSQKEFDAGHLDNVQHVNYHEPDFRDKLNALDKQKTYLVYCHSGGRSGEALEIMKSQGFREVYNMLGGHSKWSQEEGP